jgi:hypothetical protein
LADGIRSYREVTGRLTHSCAVAAEPTVRGNGPLPTGGPAHVQVNSFSLSSLIVRLNSSCSLTKALNSSGGGSSALRRACRILSSISRWRLIVSASFWRSSEVVTPAEANRPLTYGPGGSTAVAYPDHPGPVAAPK